jgi:hypothetical protein
MNKLILLIMTLVCVCPSAFSATSECDTMGTDHFILVHGIGGSKESFAYMKDVIAKDIKCSVVHEYSYETENNILTTVDFAKGLDRFVTNLAQTKEKDINIIAHSQGGIVSLLWMVNSIQGNEGFTKNLARRMDSYNTLSTPFWGSDFALMGDYTFFSLGLEDNSISPFGKTQLEHMKYGSSYVQYMMSELVRPENEMVRDFFKNDLRVFNIMATLPKLSAYSNFIGAQFFEGDAIVNVPSMTLDFNYVEKMNSEYSRSVSQLRVKEFRVSNKSYVIGSHLALAPMVQAVAEVPAECLVQSECTHIPYLNFKEFYLNSIVQTDDGIKKNLQGFELHIIVDLPEKYNSSLPVEMRVLESDGISMSYYLLGDVEQAPLSIINNKAYFLFKGSVMDPVNSKGRIELSIQGVEFNPRSFAISVDKGITTFVQTSISKKNTDDLQAESKLKMELAREKRLRRRRAEGHKH